jgi:hypothetical protein
VAFGVFLGVAHIQDGGFAAVNQHGDVLRAAALAALGQGRPQQGAARNQHDGDQKILSMKNFTGFQWLNLIRAL